MGFELEYEYGLKTVFLYGTIPHISYEFCTVLLYYIQSTVFYIQYTIYNIQYLKKKI